VDTKRQTLDPLSHFSGVLDVNDPDIAMNIAEQNTLGDYAVGAKDRMTRIANMALNGAEDGELVFERTETESISIDEGRIDTPSFSVEEGYGIERVNGKSVYFASGNFISTEAILNKARELQEFAGKSDGYIARENTQLSPPEHYSSEDIFTLSAEQRAKLLRKIDRYLCDSDRSVRNVAASLVAHRQYVLVVRADGTLASDIRPMSRLMITVQCTTKKKGVEKSDTGYSTIGGRHDYQSLADKRAWKPVADRALKEAKDKLRAKPCPSGKMTVVIGSGWGGVLLHEAIGHGFEGDFVWKNETVFADKLGKRVASDLVTIVDDGTMQGARGSLNIDDEGTPTERTVLVKNGIVEGFMLDRRSARILGMRSTGSARRESYAYPVQVRMRNTYMLSGNSRPEDMIKDTELGIYLPTFAGGQVDPLSGQFVFKAELGYMIRNGKLAEPVVGATYIGDCETILTHVDMVGNDGKLGGAGTCGKGGQSVPVGIGQPTLRISAEGGTIGGTEINAD
jgi:TldD protein